MWNQSSKSAFILPTLATVPLTAISALCEVSVMTICQWKWALNDLFNGFLPFLAGSRFWLEGMDSKRTEIGWVFTSFIMKFLRTFWELLMNLFSLFLTVTVLRRFLKASFKVLRNFFETKYEHHLNFLQTSYEHCLICA
jgi:hypothetical protein